MHHKVNLHPQNFPVLLTLCLRRIHHWPKTRQRLVFNASHTLLARELDTQHIIAGFEVILETVADRFLNFELSDGE